MTGNRMMWRVCVCGLMGLLTCQGFGQVRGRLPINQQQYQRQMEAQMEARRMQAQAQAAERQKQNTRATEQERRELEKEALKARDEGIRQTIGATEEEWRTILPRFDRVRKLAREAHFGLFVLGSGSAVRSSSSGGGRYGGTGTMGSTSGGGFGGGHGGSSAGANLGEDWNRVESTQKDGEQRQFGWKWWRPSEQKGQDELSAAERAAENLLDSYEKGSAGKEELEQKLSALREARAAAVAQLAQARKELREVLNPQQETLFILMGYLE